MDDIAAPVTRQLALHARRWPDRIAYTFLRDDGRIDELAFGELERRASALAGQLAARAAAGERAVLLYRPGLDFVIGLFGCMLAGLVAVPATLADRKRAPERLRAIAADAAPALGAGTCRAGRPVPVLRPGEVVPVARPGRRGRAGGFVRILQPAPVPPPPRRTRCRRPPAGFVRLLRARTIGAPAPRPAAPPR